MSDRPLVPATTGATVETLYLILDSWDAGGDLFLLDVAIGPADAAPDLLDAADACGGCTPTSTTAPATAKVKATSDRCMAPWECGVLRTSCTGARRGAK